MCEAASTDIVYAIVDAIDEIKPDPRELPSLGDTIDCDALNGLFVRTAYEELKGLDRLVFTYCGHTIEIPPSGRVTVGPRPEPVDP